MVKRADCNDSSSVPCEGSRVFESKFTCSGQGRGSKVDINGFTYTFEVQALIVSSYYYYPRAESTHPRSPPCLLISEIPACVVVGILVWLLVRLLPSCLKVLSYHTVGRSLILTLLSVRTHTYIYLHIHLPRSPSPTVPRFIHAPQRTAPSLPECCCSMTPDPFLHLLVISITSK